MVVIDVMIRINNNEIKSKEIKGLFITYINRTVIEEEFSNSFLITEK